MDIEFWRMATTVQAVASALMAAFFVSLARSAGAPAITLWAWGWVANLAGLILIIGYWLFLPRTAGVNFLAFSGYVFAKSAFVLCLAFGTMHLIHPKRRRWLPTGLLMAGVVAVLGGVASTLSFYYASILQNAIIAFGLGACAIYPLRQRLPYAGWLTAGLGLRALLGVGELLGNLTSLLDWAQLERWHVSTLMAASSSLDAAVEWLIALASVLAFYSLTQRDLALANAQLRQTQRDLRELASRDQLTGLRNRRALSEWMASKPATRTSLVFFDIDNFKAINDTHGHDAGDTCLRRFADTLRHNFRSHDEIMRYAGDEFIAIVPDLPGDALETRIQAVRQALREQTPGLPIIRFSHGVADVDAGGDAERALREADRAMYTLKARRRPRQGPMQPQWDPN